jgi:hypothetical protein
MYIVVHTIAQRACRFYGLPGTKFVNDSANVNEVLCNITKLFFLLQFVAVSTKLS